MFHKEGWPSLLPPSSWLESQEPSKPLLDLVAFLPCRPFLWASSPANIQLDRKVEQISFISILYGIRHYSICVGIIALSPCGLPAVTCFLAGVLGLELLPFWAGAFCLDGVCLTCDSQSSGQSIQSGILIFTAGTWCGAYLHRRLFLLILIIFIIPK